MKSRPRREAGQDQALPISPAQVAGWRGELELGDYWASWRGRSGDAALHRHFAAQAIWAPRGARLALVGRPPIEGKLLLVDPLVVHRLDPVDEVELLFLEPVALKDPRLFAALMRFRGGSVTVADQPSAPFWAPWLRDPAPSHPRRSEALDAALQQIDSQLPEGALRLGAIARAVGLSDSRFRHVFAAAWGIPFRRYVLWRRLRLAVAALRDGANATAAAHAAGFADQAHFSRTLKTMFGVTATQALRLPGARGSSLAGA